MKRLALSIVLALCVLATAGCLPDWAGRPASTVVIPASIDSSGATDVSIPFQNFIDSVPNNSVIQLRAGARYRAEQTLLIANRRNLTLDGMGATIFATTPGNGTRSHVRILQSESIVIEDLIVKGANPHAGLSDEAFDLSKEHQHGFDGRSVTGLVLLRVTVTDTYGDFVYLGKGDDRDWWTTNVIIRDSTFNRNGRMGIAMTAARNVVIEGNAFNNMRRSAFDMEAHDLNFGAENVTIRNNDIGRQRLLLVAAVGGGDVDNFTFADNRVADVLAIRMHSNDGTIRTNWKILDNTAAGIDGNPNLAVMQFDHIDGLQIHGNYQEVQTSRPMVGAKVYSSCNVSLDGNTYPGAVSQGTISGSC
ncbi:MAG: right-handed parallel beta-helix repeat-containing protein [Acidimicrobiales bacterium]